MDMTITRALAELKLLDKRIDKELQNASFIASVQKKKKINGKITVEEFNNNATKSLDSINDLIQRRKLIKSAIVQSNAKTIVSIANVKMSVADAIERKISISYEHNLLNSMKSQYHIVRNEIENKNIDVNEKLNTLLLNNFGKDIKASANDVEAISKPYLEQNEWIYVDPLDIVAKIDKLDKAIDEFESEVDFILSESNSITTIEIPD